MGLGDPPRLARHSHMRITMQDTTDFAPISLDNLDTVAGGYHDPAGPVTPSHGSTEPPESEPQATLGSHIGDLLKRLAERAAPRK